MYGFDVGMALPMMVRSAALCHLIPCAEALRQSAAKRIAESIRFMWLFFAKVVIIKSKSIFMFFVKQQNESIFECCYRNGKNKPYMKKIFNNLIVVLSPFVICAAFVLAGCTKPSNTDEDDKGGVETPDISPAIDLSTKASANCYIVSEAGFYKFKTVKGNSAESVGAVASVSVLWETFGTSEAPVPGDLIKETLYKDGYIAFNTADAFKEGNAVIAAKDAAGNVLWSWHIWLTDQPKGQEYFNNAGTMMDRNLGATSATPGDVGALGLLYQWGRKDPFLGSSSISESVLAKSTIDWPSSVQSDSSCGTIEYSIANPTTFINENKINYDWCYADTQVNDNTRWTESSSAKSIYDPCPAGWRIPDGGVDGVWAKAYPSAGYIENYQCDEVNHGVNLSGVLGSSEVIWYPFAGGLDSDAGQLGDVAYGGICYSASCAGIYNKVMIYINSGVEFMLNYTRSMGFSVRCVKE